MFGFTRAAAIVLLMAAAPLDAFAFSPVPAEVNSGLAQAAGGRQPGPPPPLDQAQTLFLRECLGKAATSKARRAYCQCTYDLLRRRYTPQQYALLDGWIRTGSPEIRRFAVVSWEPEFAQCRPLLQPGRAASSAQTRAAAGAQ